MKQIVAGSVIFFGACILLSVGGFTLKSILYLVGIVVGFMFPAVLITAIREPDDRSAEKNKIMASFLFGVLVISVLTIASY